MAATASVSLQSATSTAWSQAQQLQAERAADQAEQRAQVLQARAREAQGVADRAQENARSLAVQSHQAQNEAGQARQGLANRVAVNQVQSSLGALREQIAEVSQAALGSSGAGTLVPVVNAYGQETGKILNITA